MEQLYLLQFQKTGGARLISHLDMARLFIRAFRRAKLPLKFSEGFHAHPKVRFSPPLSVGVESLSEYCLFTLIGATRSPEVLLESLKTMMPDGFLLTGLSPMEQKPAPTSHARYEISFASPVTPQALKAAFAPPMTVTKRTKSGEKEIDLSGHLICEDIRECEGGCVLTLVSPAAEALTINPNLILCALQKKDPTLIPARILKTAAVNL